MAVSLAALFLFSAIAVAARPEVRLALVIGESAGGTGTLPACANDAGLIAQALAETGFAVTAYGDLPAEAIRRAFADFLDRAKAAGPGTDAVVYLAGTGVQFDGRNYLVPPGAILTRDEDMPAVAVDLHLLLESFAALPPGRHLAFLDLARAHRPFQDEPALASGLALDIPPAGPVVVFNTAPGAVVPPGDGEYGAFAVALASVLREPPVALDDMLSLLRLRVAALTDGGAVPFVMGQGEPDAASRASRPPLASLSPPGAFWEAVARDTLQDYAAFLTAFPNDALAPRVALMLALRREALIWQQTVRAGQATAFWTYMRRYPRGPHFAGARRMLAALSAPLDPPPRFDLIHYDGVGAPAPLDLEFINHPFVFLDEGDAPPVPPPPARILTPSLATFHDRYPPVLAFGPYDLPLPFPVHGHEAFEMGRITEPGFGNAPPVLVAQEVSDTGRMMLVHADLNHKTLSRVTLAGSPEGSGTLSQTGPTGAVIWSATAAAGHGGRTFVQWGPNHEVLSMKVVETDDTGRSTVRYSGPDGEPIAVLHLSKDGMMLSVPSGAGRRLAPAPFVKRATVMETKPPLPRPPASKPAEAMRKAPAPLADSPAGEGRAKPDTAVNRAK